MLFTGYDMHIEGGSAVVGTAYVGQVVGNAIGGRMDGWMDAWVYWYMGGYKVFELSINSKVYL